ncbi:MAG: metallophosphoesterase family protein [Paludibacter sp.]
MSNRHFAIGDIHGCFDSLKELVENKIQLQKEDKLIFLGDYIDRGPKSKEVIDYIIELQNNDYDVVTLLGNHESMLIDAYNNNGSMDKWIKNGGSETLKSFEFDSLTNIDSKYLNFFNNLKYYFENEEYLFVHAGFNDTIEDPFSDKYWMLWKSRERYSNPLLKDRTIIHGHVPVSLNITLNQIANNNKVVNIDGGCIYSNAHLGKLVALEINSSSILFV